MVFYRKYISINGALGGNYQGLPSISPGRDSHRGLTGVLVDDGGSGAVVPGVVGPESKGRQGERWPTEYTSHRTLGGRWEKWCGGTGRSGPGVKGTARGDRPSIRLTGSSMDVGGSGAVVPGVVDPESKGRQGETDRVNTPLGVVYANIDVESKAKNRLRLK